MKQRIVYPKMHFDEKYNATAKETKVVFMYLITCDTLGLTPYHRISDRQILFDTNLDQIELQKAKEELMGLRWCFFYKDWVYHNHACAYVNYDSKSPNVSNAKQIELLNVPLDVKEYFEPLITRYRPVVDQSSTEQKLEIRNKKLEIRNSGEGEIIDGYVFKDGRATKVN